MSNLAEVPRRLSTEPAKVPPAEAAIPQPGDATSVVRFFVLSVTNLFIGTVQGVVQTFPGVSQWLRAAGPAGHLIDPLAHAHINLVGGVTTGLMGVFYYVLPRLLNRPVYSPVLAATSFWFSAIGVTTFYVSLVILGLIEGNLIHAGMTYAQALEAVGPVHHVLIITGALLMGLGYWTYITNIYLTVFRKRGGRPHASAA
ncbi:MAG TPA: cbb3-type cytochrome c oxidase subunit I [Burkholderiales bacterium]|nr:cbb3-type cytochrome c oxidase subunit I [Burkholderiales bacterium]